MSIPALPLVNSVPDVKSLMFCEPVLVVYTMGIIIVVNPNGLLGEKQPENAQKKPSMVHDT